MSNRSALAREADADVDEDESGETTHLDEVPDGAGCTEIWDRLSERRDE